MVRGTVRVWLVWAAAAVLGCSEPAAAGPGQDSGPTDVAPLDAAAPDTAPLDTGTLDAQAADVPQADTAGGDVSAGEGPAVSPDVPPVPDAVPVADGADAAAVADVAAIVDVAPAVDTAPAADLASPDAGADWTDLLDPKDAADPADVPVIVVAAGCSDGTREGFGDMQKFPTLAGCGGAWDQAGIFDKPASCNREAGNTGKNAPGKGCTVSDLCLKGWHVCYGKQDVLNRNPDGCLGVMTGAVSPVFFTTQMSSSGAFLCATGAKDTNDLFGCGDLGCDFTSNVDVKAKCYPLTMSSHDQCKGLRNDLNCGDWCNHLGKYKALTNAWDCGKDTTKEALNVVKTQPGQQGGVLCCQD